MSQPNRPDWTALRGMFDDVTRAWSNVGETQRRLSQVTGTAWSPDRLIKVVVGPRGQLVDLELDPRLFRKPDAKAVAAAILATAQKAVADVGGQVRQIVEGALPRDIAGRRLVDPEIEKLVHGSDADILRGGGQ